MERLKFTLELAHRLDWELCILNFVIFVAFFQFSRQDYSIIQSSEEKIILAWKIIDFLFERCLLSSFIHMLSTGHSTDINRHVADEALLVDPNTRAFEHQREYRFLLLIWSHLTFMELGNLHTTCCCAKASDEQVCVDYKFNHSTFTDYLNITRFYVTHWFWNKTVVFIKFLFWKANKSALRADR